jgi:hypothetical protein
LHDAIVVEGKNGIRLTAPSEVFTQQRFEMPTVELKSEVAYELNLIRIAPSGYLVDSSRPGMVGSGLWMSFRVRWSTWNLDSVRSGRAGTTW